VGGRCLLAMDRDAERLSYKLIVRAEVDTAARPEGYEPPSSASTAAANSSADQEFINNAAKGNRAEVELGRMMATKAKDRGVKQFAQQMVKDIPTLSINCSS
jgi:hypothetical protein